MGYKTVFKRYELKYRITASQKELLREYIKPYTVADEYGVTNIRNVYFDTDNYRLIRASIERPPYKEKLRIRSYGPAGESSTVFVELKKKYKKVVYKRRISLKGGEAFAWITERSRPSVDTQISREIEYFLDFYGGLKPAMLITYDREAFFGRDDGNLRVTFDENILSRSTDITLAGAAYGDRVLPEGEVIMEIKCAGAIPLWLTSFLSAHRIYKTSFSKYGTAYKEYIFPRLYERHCKEKELFLNA